MKGSQKQIKWAQDVQNQILAKINSYQAEAEADAKKHGADLNSPEGQQFLATFEKARQAVLQKEDAQWFIQNSKKPVSRKSIKSLAETGEL